MDLQVFRPAGLTFALAVQLIACGPEDGDSWRATGDQAGKADSPVAVTQGSCSAPGSLCWATRWPGAKPRPKVYFDPFDVALTPLGASYVGAHINDEAAPGSAQWFLPVEAMLRVAPSGSLAWSMTNLPPDYQDHAWGYGGLLRVAAHQDESVFAVTRSGALVHLDSKGQLLARSTPKWPEACNIGGTIELSKLFIVNNELVATPPFEGTALVFSLSTLQLLRKFQVQGTTFGVLASGDFLTVEYLDDRALLRTYRAATGGKVGGSLSLSNPGAFGVSPSGSTVVMVRGGEQYQGRTIGSAGVEIVWLDGTGKQTNRASYMPSLAVDVVPYWCSVRNDWYTFYPEAVSVRDDGTVVAAGFTDSLACPSGVAHGEWTVAFDKSGAMRWAIDPGTNFEVRYIKPVAARINGKYVHILGLENGIYTSLRKLVL